MKKHHILFLCIATLIMLLLACSTSGGYTETGSMTRSSFIGRKGTITTTVRKANGSTTKEIELSDTFSSGEELYLDATLEVESGSYQVEFLDGDQVVLTLLATPGESAQGTTTVKLDVFSRIKYRVTAENAEKVKLTIQFERQ